MVSGRVGIKEKQGYRQVAWIPTRDTDIEELRGSKEKQGYRGVARIPRRSTNIEELHGFQGKVRIPSSCVDPKEKYHITQ